MSSKHSLRSRHRNRECGASLNARKYAREKKKMGKNLQPKQCSKQQTTTSEVQVCRFEKGPNLASLKSHLQSQENSVCQSMMNVIGQYSHDGIG